MAFNAGHTDSQAIVVGRASADIPELPHVLRRNAKLAILPVQSLQCLPRDRAKRILVLNRSEQNVGVEERILILSGVTTGRDTSSRV